MVNSDLHNQLFRSPNNLAPVEQRRVGVLVPWANVAVESELHRFEESSISWHYSRLVPGTQTTELDDDFLSGLIEAAPDATYQLSKLPLRALLLACTSAGFNSENDLAVNSTAVSLRLITAFEALVRLLQTIRAKRIALLTPYPRYLTLRGVGSFLSKGIEVLDHVSMGWLDDFGQIAPDDIYRLASTLDDSALTGADAAVLSCTGWHTFDMLGPLSEMFGIPVISSNMALVAVAVEECM